MDRPFEEEFYSVAQVAKQMKVSRYVVNRLIESGELTAYSFGRSYRITNTDLTNYLKRKKENNNA